MRRFLYAVFGGKATMKNPFSHLFRALENLNPISEEEGGNAYLVNGNMIPISRAGLGVLLGLATQSEAEPAEEEPATEETTSAEKEGDENGETTDARQPV